MDIINLFDSKMIYCSVTGRYCKYAYEHGKDNGCLCRDEHNKRKRAKIVPDYKCPEEPDERK